MVEVEYPKGINRERKLRGCLEAAPFKKFFSHFYLVKFLLVKLTF